MNVLDATRAWMRAQCPLINRQDLFNANYLGAEPTEYTLRTASESHRIQPDLCGTAAVWAGAEAQPGRS